jgi:lycopene beta-cyclase
LCHSLQPQPSVQQKNIPINNSANYFDYIILGAGCAGLSLAVRMIQSGALSDKKILLVDRAPKTLNDRTWCFWEKPGGKNSSGSPSLFFKEVVYHSWKSLWLRHPQNDVSLDLGPYRYNMIRGQDFYKHCFSIISGAPNVQVQYGEVSNIDPAQGMVEAGGTRFFAEHIFSSVLLEPPMLQPDQYYLLQHFRGWWIETKEDAFDPAQADLMNFNTGQQHGCTFLYVLPVSPRKALVEYTLFTEDELTSEEYDEGLRDFISQKLKLENYTITEVENGVIPMTNLVFPQQKDHVFFIGTAGGQTKASTGYTFQFIQKQTAAIVASIIQKDRPEIFVQPSRFRFYDSVMLRVLHEERMPGDEIFYRMFQKNKAEKVLRFLDNESSFIDELQIMNSSKKSIFLPAALKELF